MAFISYTLKLIYDNFSKLAPNTKLNIHNNNKNY